MRNLPLIWSRVFPLALLFLPPSSIGEALAMSEKLAINNSNSSINTDSFTKYYI